MSDNITLEFLARQLARLIDDVATVRDDMAVLTAITMRVDAAVSGSRRVEALEKAHEP